MLLLLVAVPGIGFATGVFRHAFIRFNHAGNTSMVRRLLVAILLQTHRADARAGETDKRRGGTRVPHKSRSKHERPGRGASKPFATRLFHPHQSAVGRDKVVAVSAMSCRLQSTASRHSMVRPEALVEPQASQA